MRRVGCLASLIDSPFLSQSLCAERQRTHNKPEIFCPGEKGNSYNLSLNMGQSSSNRRHNQCLSPSQLLSSSSSPNPPANTFPGFSPPPPPAAAAANTTAFSGFSPPPPAAAPPPPPPPPPYPSHPYPSPSTYPPHFYAQYSPAYSNASGYAASPSGHRLSCPYYPNQNHGWSPFRPPSSQAVSPMPPPPPFVEHQNTTTVKNAVNLHKGTIRLEVDEQNPDAHLVTFTFDASVDGSFTIFYFAKEGDNCSFSPLYPDYFVPVRVPFQKGVGQKFHQPSGTGIDLGFFVLEDLAKPTSDNGFPLVISAEAYRPPSPAEEQLRQSPPTGSAQITEAVMEKQNGETLKVKVVKQILWVDGVRYELKDLFGIEKSAQEEFDDNEPGKECVICLSEPKDTAVLPCRHLCMCSECAKVLRFQTNTCPICRQPVEQLIEIKIKKDNQ